MKNLELFPIVSADNDLRNLLYRDGKVQFYEFGLAQGEPVLPYVVWQQVGGDSYLNFDSISQSDRLLVDVMIYAKTGSEAKSLVNSLRKVLDKVGYVDDIGILELQDSGTYKYTMTYAFHVTL
jgi:hypothetical protein